MLQRLLPALLLFLPACFVFDAQLYQQRRDGGGTDADAAPPTDAAPDAAPAVALAERCTGDVPVRASSTTPFILSTLELGDDINQVSACTGTDTLGHDGFFALDIAPGERWHVHVRPMIPTVDPAVYFLRTCDDRSCAPGDGEDECGSGRDEHISIAPPGGGRFIVAIDSRGAGGGVFEVTALRPTCGNRVAEHSESCEDGNTTDGDGCDSRCRAEISAGSPMEVEPNDDALGANVLAMPATGGSMAFRGRVGGRCDYDTYALQVPANGSVQAAVAHVSGACTADAPPVRAALLLSDGRTEVARAAGTTAAPCPTLTTTAPLSAGTYYLRLNTVAADAAGFDYQVQIAVTP